MCTQILLNRDSRNGKRMKQGERLLFWKWWHKLFPSRFRGLTTSMTAKKRNNSSSVTSSCVWKHGSSWEKKRLEVRLRIQDWSCSVKDKKKGEQNEKNEGKEEEMSSEKEETTKLNATTTKTTCLNKTRQKVFTFRKEKRAMGKTKRSCQARIYETKRNLPGFLFLIMCWLRCCDDNLDWRIIAQESSNTKTMRVFRSLCDAVYTLSLTFTSKIERLSTQT